MEDLSDFKGGQIVDAVMAGASVTKIAQLFGVARSTISKIFEKEGKISSLKQDSGRKRKLSDMDRRTLTQILRKDYKDITPKIIAEVNGHLENPVSSKNNWKSCPQPYFTGGMQSENRIKINLFEISRHFHYFFQPLFIGLTDIQVPSISIAHFGAFRWVNSRNSLLTKLKVYFPILFYIVTLFPDLALYRGKLITFNTSNTLSRITQQHRS